MWLELGVALSLMLILEGILPFLNPRLWRHMVTQASMMQNSALRISGLVSMLLGLALLTWLR